MKEKTHIYEDIIDLPHHVSEIRPQMSLADRAAQFSPFAALTGYDAAIRETGRLTCKKTDLSDDIRAELDRRQAFLSEIIDTRPEIEVTYFVADSVKKGGTYVSVTGNLRCIDRYERLLIFTDGRKIPMNDIAAIDSECFRSIPDKGAL